MQRRIGLEESVVGRDDPLELSALEPGRDRLVAKENSAAWLGDAREFRRSLVQIAELVETAKVENSVEGTVGKRKGRGIRDRIVEAAREIHRLRIVSHLAHAGVSHPGGEVLHVEMAVRAEPPGEAE